ncbi:GNAT family N-acetyltransferase [Limoniibacter endophyticus]|uniref:Ribosomal-protein-alanine acetyltransferase n=1 Tax=Limoniibacter endophyticus TaxID=1565040 RepID=A0A8J3DNQ6_9HYPH|nr:N-acetyltransferase [Limoniibacter endophyticus]GHC74617.1 ribosomal-protein-alanine acetyltransferase [Limoniibacter endophyticus]
MAGILAWILSLFSRRSEYIVMPLEQIADIADLPFLHAQGFSRVWSEEEFASLIAQDNVFGFTVRESGRSKRPHGFVLARHAAGEGEILTIVVSKAKRGEGLGRMLMEAVLRELHKERAEVLLLEVDETNASAIGLYKRLGFTTVGTRPGYYRDGEGKATGAFVMQRDLIRRGG